jgi:1-acyl-sn-glycerol-3-phosphate acyltransferase
MKPVSAIEPSAAALESYNRFLRWSGWAGRLLLKPWLSQVEVFGRENLETGAALVLMNHSCMFDPFVLTVHARRPIQFLVTEPFMKTRAGAVLASRWGQIPKRKLDPDARSMRLLKQWTELGGAVGLFPEGQFPWDGEPLPLQPGLSQLVSYLQVPVVTCRLMNADRVWPSWAKHPRRTRLRLEIDPPRFFGNDPAVESYVAERIHVDPRTSPRWPAKGKRLAEGLAQFLRYCPECGEDGKLTDAGNVLRCSSCLRSWDVNADNQLTRGDEKLTVAQIRRRARTQWEKRWHESGRFESQGPVEVLDISRKEEVLLARGRLLLEGSHLRVDDWSLDLQGLSAHTLDWDQRLVLRTARQRLAIRMPEDSRALWTVAFDAAGSSVATSRQAVP